MTTRLGVALVLAAVCSGCAGVVKQQRTAQEYATVAPLERVKRVAVVTAPWPEGREAVGRMWSALARTRLNQQTNYIAKADLALAEGEAAAVTGAACVEGVEGVVWLRPTGVRLEGEGPGARVHEDVTAELLACAGAKALWSAEARGTWESKGFEAIRDTYVARFGDEVAPYVTPAWKLLFPVLDALPKPALSEADTDEKIEFGE